MAIEVNFAMRPALSIVSLVLAVQCRPAAVAITPAHAGVADGAPIADWLPDTEWNCAVVIALGGQRFEVEHSWSFSETTWASDIGEKLSEAANAGTIPQTVAQELGDWITQDTSTLTWSPTIHTNGRHWSGTSDSTILLERMAKWSTNDGIGYRFSIQPFEDSQGNERFEFINAGAQTHSIICENEFVADVE